jgi:hypothetical protein
MRQSLSVAIFALVLIAPSIGAQAVDQTMVPRGFLRIQAHPAFSSWDARFGVAVDGSRGIESLGDDLTDPTSLSLFPGIPSLQQAVRDVSGIAGYTPVLGASNGRITQDFTRVDLGGHVGVLDWLTVGVVVPLLRSRTAVDVVFSPDTVNGNLGLNPVITNPGGVGAFLQSALTAQSSARAQANAACSGGASPTCTSAGALADRTDAFTASMQSAFSASPFFPLAGSVSGDALLAAAASLNTDLGAAGVSTLSAMSLATQTLAADEFAQLPMLGGAGIDAGALQPRKGLWRAGDMEVSARVRLLDNTAPSGASTSGLQYRITGSFLARLPTGTPENPDILLDLGADAQTDLEGGLAVALGFGEHAGVAMSVAYGTQGATTRVMRVGPHELVMPPASSRREVRWTPGSYMGVDVSPTFMISSGLTFTGAYRFFKKGRDVFALVTADPSLDPVVMAVESGVKAHQVGGGLRYDTVEPWRRGNAPRPMEIHFRYLRTFAGDGGQTPRATRVEAGVRLFRRFWGPTR